MTQPCTEKETITTLKTHQETILSDVKTILDILQGNGRAGLKTQVAIHKTYFKIIAAIGAPLLTFLTARAVWALFVK